MRKFLFKEYEFRALKSRIYGKKSPINQNVKFRFYSTQKKMIIKMFIYNITSVPWGYCYQKVQKKKRETLDSNNINDLNNCLASFHYRCQLLGNQCTFSAQRYFRKGVNFFNEQKIPTSVTSARDLAVNSIIFPRAIIAK